MVSSLNWISLIFFPKPVKFSFTLNSTISKTSSTKRKITFTTTLRYAPISSEGRSLSGANIYSTNN